MNYITPFFLILICSCSSYLAGNTIADEVRSQTKKTIQDISHTFIKTDNNNLIPRPWGGSLLSKYKGITYSTAQKIGESFEIAACPAQKDKEAAQYPSMVTFKDKSRMPLPELLEYAGEEILGAYYVKRIGKYIPLLPKTLNIAQLLSFQTHPQGNIETYIILDCFPGATIRLGFNKTIDKEKLVAMAWRGRKLQERLLLHVRKNTDQSRMYDYIARAFARKDHSITVLVNLLFEFMNPGSDLQEITKILTDLKKVYWYMLDQLNEIEVRPGQIIHNANPERYITPSSPASAEIHALGNPNNYEILALEIRRPGTTYRLWDNARFPLRLLDIETALSTLNLQQTDVKDFIVEPLTIAPGIEKLVDSESYIIERLTVELNKPILQTIDRCPHFLFAINGAIKLTDASGKLLGVIQQGESGIMPVGVTEYTCVSISKSVIIKVTLPI